MLETSESKVTSEERERHAEVMDSIKQYDEPYTYQHCKRVGHVAALIAKYMGKTKDECEIIRMAGELHDVGKITVDKDLLHKNGQYDDEEFEKVALHAIEGPSVLQQMGVTRQAFLDAAGEHHRYHEASKGGYGAKTYKESEHPSEIAQIMAVADVYDALASARPYKPALPTEKIREIMEENANKGQFSKDICNVFMSEVFDDLELARFVKDTSLDDAKKAAGQKVDEREDLDERFAPREGASGAEKEDETPHK